MQSRLIHCVGLILILFSFLTCKKDSNSLVPLPNTAAKVSIDTFEVHMLIGDSFQLVAKVFDKDGNMITDPLPSWSSSNEQVVTVNTKGQLHAVSTGVADISATLDRKSAKARVTVTAPIERIVIIPDSLKIQIGASRQLSISAFDANDFPVPLDSISWSSSDETKATVSSSGVVTPLKEGTVAISASSDGKLDTCQLIIVRLPDKVNYVSFQGQEYQLQPWFGKNIVFLTRQWDLELSAMDTIVTSLDSGYAYYHKMTGKEPFKYDPTVINNRATIASVDETCGPACAYVGFTGIEMVNEAMDEFYSGVHTEGALNTTLFYLLGSNFWLFSDQLYFETDFNMNIAAGYAEFMKYMAIDYVNLPMSLLDNFARTDVESMINQYQSSTDWDWSMVVKTGDSPQGFSSGHLLFASLLMYFQKNFGKNLFIERFFKEVGKRDKTGNVQDAIDNMAIAISAGANINLSKTLTDDWRVPISDNVKQEATERFGTAF